MRGTSARIFALVEKDARIHGPSILATQAALLVVAGFAVRMKPDADSVNATLVLNFNLLFAGFWSEWLVSREKTKGTFAWLRASALTDSELVLAKFLAVSLCTTVLWVASALLFVRPTFPQGVMVWAGLQTFSGLAVASRWRFGAKLGQTLPYVALLIPLLVLVAFDRFWGVRIDVADLIETPIRYLIASVFLIGAWAAVLAAVKAWVSRADTVRFLE